MPSKELTAVVPETLEDRSIQVEVTLPVRQRRRESRSGGAPDVISAARSRPQIPRITRLMALAIKFQEMVNCGEVRDYADLARLGYVTRARITQIMNLLNLAPGIQEQILLRGVDPEVIAVPERSLRCLTSVANWSDQKVMWSRLQQSTAPHRVFRQ